MANNRLYLRNRKTGDFFTIAKSFGNGWKIVVTFLDLQRWIDSLSDDASFGDGLDVATDLELVAESDPRCEIVDDLLQLRKQSSGAADRRQASL